MRILIVEDNADLADLVKRGLHQAGFNCDVVGTTEEARGLMSSNAYALISLDLGLPGEDGLTFLKGLREARNPVPVLIITARSSIGDRVDGLRSGADDYLVKPFALEELVARVEALLRRPHQLDDLVLTVGNITFHARQRMVSVGGKPWQVAGAGLTRPPAAIVICWSRARSSPAMMRLRAYCPAKWCVGGNLFPKV